MKKFLRDIEIGYKLMASFLLIAVLTTFIGIYSIQSVKSLERRSSLMYERGAVPLGLFVITSDEINKLCLQARNWRLSKTDEGRATALKAFDKSYANLKNIIAQQKELVLAENGKEVLDNLQATIDKYASDVHAYTSKTTIRSPFSGGLTAIDFSSDILESEIKMNRALDAARETRVHAIRTLSEQSSREYSNDRIYSTVILIVAVLLSIAIGSYLTLSITKPIRRFAREFSKVEKGDMTIRMGLSGKDELGMLAKSIDSLISKLHEVFTNLRRDSDTLANSAAELSDISTQLASGAKETSAKTTSVSSAMEQMSANIKSIAGTAEESAANVVNVTNAVEAVAGNINAMASGAEKASENASEVAGAAEQMSANISTIASAIEEMSASINQISGNAGAASKVAGEATVKSGEATGAMSRLGIAAKEIGQVTDIIKKIADKTNLLALNATIEAASAGAAGKGFAVVAGEIKDLANQSAQSADDIANRIQSIQTGTDEAVTVINEVSEIIEDINQSVEAISNLVGQQTKASNEIANNVAQANIGTKRVAESMGEVAKGSKEIARNASEANMGARHVVVAMGDVAKGSKEIARNAGEAAGGADEVSHNVFSVSQVAEKSAQGASQINHGAGELAKLASNLKSVLSQFKV